MQLDWKSSAFGVHKSSKYLRSYKVHFMTVSQTVHRKPISTHCAALYSFPRPIHTSQVCRRATRFTIRKRPSSFTQFSSTALLPNLAYIGHQTLPHHLINSHKDLQQGRAPLPQRRTLGKTFAGLTIMYYMQYLSSQFSARSLFVVLPGFDPQHERHCSQVA